MTKGPSTLAASRDKTVQQQQFSGTYTNFVLFMLILVTILNFIDRQILSILLEPIKAEFQLTDTQLGFLTGFSFAVFYTLFGIPLARLADSGNRKNLISVVIIIWSAMTAICGLATSFLWLVLARIGVAIGEAGSAPAAQSMLSDYFPPNRRVSVLGILYTGVYLGLLLGFLMGGWINEFFGWRAAFFVVGIPGVIFALIFRLTVKEPPRGYSEGIVDTGEIPGIGQTFKYLWNIPTYRQIPFAAGFYAFVAYGSMAWLPSFFIRTHGLSTGELGTWLALAVGVGGGTACLLGGFLTDYLANRTNDKRWYMWVPAITILLSIPFVCGIYLSPTPGLALFMAIGAFFFGNTWLGPTIATIQSITPSRMRAMSFATMIVIHNVIGLGLGPQVVGIFSDYLKEALGDDSLRYSLLITMVITSLISTFHYLMAARTLRQDMKQNLG